MTNNEQNTSLLTALSPSIVHIGQRVGATIMVHLIFSRGGSGKEQGYEHCRGPLGAGEMAPAEFSWLAAAPGESALRASQAYEGSGPGRRQSLRYKEEEKSYLPQQLL